MARLRLRVAVPFEATNGAACVSSSAGITFSKSQNERPYFCGGAWSPWSASSHVSFHPISHATIRIEAANLTGSGASNNIEEDDDWTQVFGRCWVWGFVTCDLLLLENKIPFFVMQKLFQQLRTDPDESSDVLVAGALRLFRSLRPRKLHSSAIAVRDVHHLLHLFYLSVGLPEAAVSATDNDPCRHAAPPSELPQWIPSARELEEAGVKFCARKDAKSFLDVRFHGGVLEIPELELYDYSEPLSATSSPSSRPTLSRLAMSPPTPSSWIALSPRRRT